ncbi:multiple sugar transport system substrate-binding protein [Paenibacillus phyllosphaerae]|uniref:Multiple sugar transport system substrate-binding protein n=1 Tax=Paenibacillus phyllosphaerae TaxID=274593 RepID=A0A7W5B4F1_9BACL|nr:sugar ABC transporter substrate-binding protein [Paenibacillus phyllosphaerae]MBB3114173.1 multiple sugar transport system substrate-binding protein [Paenibacillus phyllosphaerae]
MMRSRKAIQAVAAVMLLSTFLAGCAGSNNNGAATTDNKEGNASSTNGQSQTEGNGNAAQDQEPVTLKFTFWGSPQEKTAIEQATKKFTEKYPWITVDAIHIPEADYDAKITAMVAGNESPDLGYMHGELADPWQKEDKFVNMFELLDNDDELKREDFLDYIWFKSSEDFAYGISTAGETFGLFYNKDLFDEAQLSYPPAKPGEAWTWDEFVEVAKKLTIDQNGNNATEPDFNPDKIRQFGVSFETWHGPIHATVINNEGEWITKDGKFGFSQPEATEAIQRLADLINVHHVAPSPVQMKSIPSQAVALQSKLVAMSMHGQWINLDLGAAKVNYDIGVLPKMKRSVPMGISGASVIYKSTKHLEEAWLLTKFLENPEGSIDLYRDGLWMPTMTKWYTDPELVAKWAENNPAHPSGFKDAMMNNLLNNGVPNGSYYIKNFSKINAITFSGMDEVWLGKKTAEQAMKDIEAKVQPEIQGRYDVTP